MGSVGTVWGSISGPLTDAEPSHCCLTDLAVDGSTGKAASTPAKTSSQTAYLSIPLLAC